MPNKILTVPWMGPYTTIFLSCLRHLGLQTVAPPPTTSATISIGVKAMHELICLPAKATLGNMVEAGDRGATDAVMWDSCGDCRLKCYYILQQAALRQAGRSMQVHPIRFQSLIGDIRRLDKSISRRSVVKQTISALKRIYAMDKHLWGTSPNGADIKVGLMGEIYTVNDPAVNMGLVKKLKRLGVYVGNLIHLSHFVFKPFYSKHLMSMPFTDKKVWKESKRKAYKLFPKAIGGHGNDSITSLFYYHQMGYSGAIHLLPFPCLPEASVADMMDQAATELDFPLIHLIFDEHNSDAGLDTRLEAFVDMLKFRKDGW